LSFEKTREPQYNPDLELKKRKGASTFGIMSNAMWANDPKHLVFTLSRYKFVAKMLSGLSNVLEVGCADAFGTRIVKQHVKDLTAIDFDPVFVRDVIERMDDDWRFSCKLHDMLDAPIKENFDAAYSLDVIEHINSNEEHTFISNIVDSLNENGILIIGTPSIESQKYACEGSKAGHVNCKGQEELKELMQNYFHNVFIFSMNDEVVHTGFYPMAHYLFALCCAKKN